MRKLFFGMIITIMTVSCNQANEKETDASGNTTEMNDLYEANLAAYKNQVAAFEKEDLNAWASEVADTAVWNSPMYGDTITSKAHWVESTKYDFDNFSNLHLTDAQFLPGVDSTTHQPDGSVRYYGTWNGTSLSGKEVSVKFYGTYNFDKDHKIIFGSDYFDAGGLMNALKPQ